MNQAPDNQEADPMIEIPSQVEIPSREIFLHWIWEIGAAFLGSILFTGKTIYPGENYPTFRPSSIQLQLCPQVCCAIVFMSRQSWMTF
jgi:hypothetical protein